MPGMCGYVKPGIWYQPSRCTMSSRFSAHASTRTSTSSRARRRVGHVDVLEHLGATGVVVADGLHFKPRMNGRANAAGWRTRVAKIVIATMVTRLGAIARNAGSMDW